jgi:predicted GNAT family acetyltransferase/uncharacterized Fe-S cluster protein YjdI
MREYSNGEITIIWQPKKCTHSGICFKTLPEVYHPKEKPWVRPENATTDELIAQIECCPSGALTWHRNDVQALIIRHENDEKQGIFVAIRDDIQIGLMTYIWIESKKFVINHTEVDPDFEGTGIGKKLVYAAVDYARENELKIIPMCSFAKALFNKDSGIRDVL